MKLIVYITLLLITLSSYQLDAQHWPNWRGPNNDGVSLNGTPPIEWSETKNIKWKIPIPGKGLGTPVVWGNQIFITTAIELDQQAATETIERIKKSTSDQNKLSGLTKNSEEFLQFVVYSINRNSGEINWKRVVREQYPHAGILHISSFASASCVTDGKHVIASFGSFGIYCFDMNGNIIWEKDLGDMQDPFACGEGTSPVIYKNNLIIVWDHAGQSKIYVLDKQSGKEIWQKNRNERNTWATPLVVEIEGRPQIITPGRDKTIGYNLVNGNMIWELSGLGTDIITSPVSDGERVFLMTGSTNSEFVQAVNLKNAYGNIDSSVHIAWTYNRNTPYIASPLLEDGKLYYSKGSMSHLSCVNAKTGEIYYNAIKPSGMLAIYASPVSANGNIYLIDRRGTCSVIKEGSTFEMVAQNKLDDTFDASPAIAGNDLILRGLEYLYCISE